MAVMTRYHLGGFDPAAPQQNRSELYDGGAGTYTAWDTSGVQTASRPLTSAEAAILSAEDAAVLASSNQATVQQQAQSALVNNRTYLAIGSPTNAQVVAQVRAVTQQLQGLIRMALGQFDSTN